MDGASVGVCHVFSSHCSLLIGVYVCVCACLRQRTCLSLSWSICFSAWDFGKLIVLKLVNIIVLYIVKRYVQLAHDVDCGTLSQELCNCPLEGMGYQFFFLMVTDLVVRGLHTCVVSFPVGLAGCRVFIYLFCLLA